MRHGQASLEYLLILAGLMIISALVANYVVSSGTTVQKATVEEANRLIAPKDKSPPTTSILCNGAPCTTNYKEDVTISFICQDNLGGSGCRTTHYSLNGTDWNSCSQPGGCKGVIKLNKPASGSKTYTVYFYSEDKNGNIETQRKVVIKIGTEFEAAGACTITFTPPYGRPKDPITVSIASTTPVFDAVASIVQAGIIRKIGDLGTGAPAEISFTPADEGIYTAEVNGKDAAGNVGTCGEANVIVDGTPPKIALPPSEWWINTTTISASITDEGNPPSGLSAYVYKVRDLNVNKAYTSRWIKTSGEHVGVGIPYRKWCKSQGCDVCEVGAGAKDNSGNSKELSKVYSIDIVAPNVPNPPTPEGWVNHPISTTIECNDPQPGSGCKLVGYRFVRPDQPCEYDFAEIATDDGNHICTFYYKGKNYYYVGPRKCNDIGTGEWKELSTETRLSLSDGNALCLYPNGLRTIHVKVRSDEPCIYPYTKSLTTHGTTITFRMVGGNVEYNMGSGYTTLNSTIVTLNDGNKLCLRPSNYDVQYVIAEYNEDAGRWECNYMKGGRIPVHGKYGSDFVYSSYEIVYAPTGTCPLSKASHGPATAGLSATLKCDNSCVRDLCYIYSDHANLGRDAMNPVRVDGTNPTGIPSDGAYAIDLEKPEVDVQDGGDAYVLNPTGWVHDHYINISATDPQADEKMGSGIKKIEVNLPRSDCVASCDDGPPGNPARWNTSPVASASIRCKITAEEGKTCTATRANVNVVDYADNNTITSIPFSPKIRVDKVLPVLESASWSMDSSFAPLRDCGWYQQMEAKATATDKGSGMYGLALEFNTEVAKPDTETKKVWVKDSLKSAKLLPGEESYTFTVRPYRYEGYLEMNVYPVDNVGNRGDGKELVSPVPLDTEPPSISISLDHEWICTASNKGHPTEAHISAYATDFGSKMYSIEYSGALSDEEDARDCQTTRLDLPEKTISSTAPTTRTIWVVAKDNAGNESIRAKTVEVLDPCYDTSCWVSPEGRSMHDYCYEHSKTTTTEQKCKDGYLFEYNKICPGKCTLDAKGKPMCVTSTTCYYSEETNTGQPC